MNLRLFLEQSTSAGDVRRIRCAIDPNLELAAICRREFLRPGGRALLFENLKGNNFSAAGNLFGSDQRLMKLLRSESFPGFAEKLRHGLNQFSGPAAERLWKLAASSKVTRCRKAPFWQFRPKATLRDLPAIRSWAKEGPPYLTLPLVISCHPLTGVQNIGICRVQILGPRQAAINIRPETGVGQHLQIAQQQGGPLPLALVFGSDLALYWLATAPLPPGCNEYGLLHSLFGEKLSLAKSKDSGLMLPHDAEFVVEGEIPFGAVTFEGPFGNHTGSYVTRADCPRMEVHSIAWRDQPIMPITVVGPPPSENIFLGRANETLIREMLAIDYPEILGLRMPESTLFHGAALLNITATATGLPELIERLWSCGPLQKAKLLVFLDPDIPLAGSEKVYWRLVNQLSVSRIYRRDGQIAIDATGVDPSQLVEEDSATANLVFGRVKEYDGGNSTRTL